MLLAQDNKSFPPRSLLPTNAVTVSQHYDNSQSASNFAVDGTQLEPTALLLPASQPPDKSWESYFPSREEGDLLYYQYFAAVDPLVHILHEPSFALTYGNFTSRFLKTQLTPSSKALLLAVYFAAVISLSPMQCEMQLGIQQQILVVKLKAATKKALIDADYLSSVKLQTLQAFTIYLIPRCREQVSMSDSVLVGALVRLAECAGLHHGRSNLAMSSTETQVRRILWHQICFLDIRTAESQGSQPTAREDEADTPLPWNVNDMDLDDASRQASNSGWTSVTFSLIKYECYMVHRLIFRQRVAIGNKTIDLATVRRQIDQRKRLIEEKYLRHLDQRIPVQRCARLVGKVLISKFDPMLLQGHLQDTKKRSHVEHELHNTIIKRGLEICESAIILETATDLAPWAWYSGAYQQHHQAILLLMEVHRTPSIPYAIRINAVLDFVFGAPLGMSSIERNRNTLRLLAEECTIYMQRREVKAAEVFHEERSRPKPNTNVNTHHITPAAQPSTYANPQQTAPVPYTMNQYQEATDWQLGLGFDINPTQYFAAPDMSDWTNLFPYQSTSGNSIHLTGGES